MSVHIVEVKSRRDLRKFINLPAAIHRDHKNWVPPLYMDDRVFFNPKKNEAFSFSDTILLLALKNKKLVGRIMGIINHKYNNAHDEKEGRFCFLETYDDFEVAHTLIQFIEEWARSKGMKKLVGPLGFSDKDPQGLLIEGFDKPVVIATNCNFPYLVNIVEKTGYSKKVDLVVYKLMIPDDIPEFYKRIHERAIKNKNGIKIVNFTSRKQMKSYVRPVLTLLNETFKDTYAFTPLSNKEMDEFASRYLMILDPRFLKVIENEKNEVVAFILAMPDISEGIKKCQGRLIPFGIFQILRSQKKTKQLNLLLGGIKEEYRNSGLDTIMGVKVVEEAKKAGIEYIDGHLQLETNTKMRAEMEKMGGIVYKRFRIFTKAL
jgi:hypothetical protein